MSTKAEEQAELTQEEQKHLQERIAKITAGVERAMSAVNDVMALISTGMKLYKDTKAQIEKIKRDVGDLKNAAVNAAAGFQNTAKNMGNAITNPNLQTLTTALNPSTLNNAVGNTVGAINSATSAANSAFNTLDSGMGSLNYVLSSTDYLPNKVQEKISQKQLQLKLQQAQKKLREFQAAAQKWIKENTEKYASKITSRQKELQDQLNRQIQKAVNSIATFTGMDPVMLEDLIEKAEKTGMAYATGKKNAADQLDDLIGFAKSSAINQAMNMATAKGLEALDKAGFKDLVDDIKKDVPAIKKITGVALEKAGISNNLGNNIANNLQNRLNIKI